MTRIRLVLLDFDGTMTDDFISIDQDGRETVRCHRADGWGIRLLRQAGIEVLCVSSERNPVVRHRCRKLGIKVLAPVIDKGLAVRRVMQQRALTASQCAFLGNGLNDVPALQAVGWPVVVRNAHPKAKRVARQVLSVRGGEGAVLQLAEHMLGTRANGK